MTNLRLSWMNRRPFHPLFQFVNMRYDAIERRAIDSEPNRDRERRSRGFDVGFEPASIDPDAQRPGAGVVPSTDVLRSGGFVLETTTSTASAPSQMR